jgi:hypothetical protein
MYIFGLQIIRILEKKEEDSPLLGVAMINKYLHKWTICSSLHKLKLSS